MTHSPERETLIARLESSQERLLKMLAGVPEQRSSIHTAEGRWSVRDIVEHLVLVEGRMIARVENGVESTEAPKYELDAQLHQRGMDRVAKRPAPEAAQPKGAYPSLAHAVAALKSARKMSIEYVKAYPKDLRTMRVEGPVEGMDAHQLLMYMALHTERHALQIDEITNDPAFRK